MKQTSGGAKAARAALEIRLLPEFIKNTCANEFWW